MVETTVSVTVSMIDTEPLPSLVAYARDCAQVAENEALNNRDTTIEKCNFFIKKFPLINDLGQVVAS
jgi:hypothetical protein